MFASIVTGGGDPKTIDQAEQYWKKSAGGKGYVRGYMVVDRKTGKWMTFNLWETEADARGYETSGGYQRDLKEAAALGASNMTREVWELVGEK